MGNFYEFANFQPGTRQTTSTYACDACASMQESLGIKNVTGTRKENGKIQRLSY